MNPKPFEVNSLPFFETKNSGGPNSEMIFEGFKAGGSYSEGPSLTGPVIGYMDGDQEVVDSLEM